MQRHLDSPLIVHSACEQLDAQQPNLVCPNSGKIFVPHIKLQMLMVMSIGVQDLRSILSRSIESYRRLREAEAVGNLPQRERGMGHM